MSWKKIVGIALAAIVIFFVLSVYGIIRGELHQTSDISYYRALSGEIEGPVAQEIMGEEGWVDCPYDLPTLNELGPYAEIRFDYTAKRDLIFESHAYILITTYEAEAYDRIKEQAYKEFPTWMPTSDEWERTDLDSEFTLDHFDFRAVEGGSYPAQMFWIGTSDGRKEIAWFFFYDQELDRVSQGMEHFMTAETGWANIR